MDLRSATGALLLSGSAILPVAAQGVAGNPAADGLKGIVVTATRTPRARSATLAPTTVITRADIERLQAHSVGELLRRTPGLSVANQGGPGKLTSMFMRGTESDHVLVLVDGVRYGDATSGLAKIQDLPVGQIERIEVVRGPRSSLYGADAIGGVVQIFTRDGTGSSNAAEPYFNVGAGTYSTYEGQAGVAGRTARGHYNIGVSGTDADGFNACTGRAPDPETLAGGAGCFTDDPDDDGYSRLSGSLRAGYRFDSGLAVNAHYLRADGDNDFDGSTSNHSDTVQEVYGVSAAGRPAEPWHAELALGRSRDLSDDRLDGLFVSTFKTVRDSVSFQNDVALAPDHLLTLGLDYRREEVVSTVDFNQRKRDNKGVFLQYLGTLGRHELQLAVRGDDNEQFGEHATGSATYGYDLSDVYIVTASYGTAFKAPTFNELYYPDFSNPDLAPEESQTAEIGLVAEPDWGRWTVYAYETRIDQLIALDSEFLPRNISETRLRGVEAEVGTRLGAWQFNASATWLDAENRADGANAGNELPRRPAYTAQFDIDREFGRYSAGTSLSLAGSRYDDLANTRKLEGYELIDLRASVQLNPDWRVQARLSNLFDEDYETIAFFNQPGRSLFVTLRYGP